MNCAQYQKKIADSLAAGVGTPSSDVSAHQLVCAACREFCEAQASLFRSMDRGLRSMANPEIPSSLAPGISARLGRERFARRPGITHWGLAAMTAAAILVVSLGVLRRWPKNLPNAPERGRVVYSSAGIPIPRAQNSRKSPDISPVRTYKHVKSAASSLTPTEAAPEVIVLAEERQAFAEFVAELPREKDVALALTRPAPEAEDAPLEIALLQTSDIEVKPLDGAPRE